MHTAIAASCVIERPGPNTNLNIAAMTATDDDCGVEHLVRVTGLIPLTTCRPLRLASWPVH